MTRKLQQLVNLQAGWQPSDGMFSAQHKASMEWGQHSEPVAAWNYQQSQPGSAVFPTGAFIHPAHHLLMASPDRVVQLANGTMGLLEIKCPASRSIPSAPSRDACLQAFTQLACQPPSIEVTFVDIYYWGGTHGKAYTGMPQPSSIGTPLSCLGLRSGSSSSGHHQQRRHWVSLPPVSGGLLWAHCFPKLEERHALA